MFSKVLIYYVYIIYISHAASIQRTILRRGGGVNTVFKPINSNLASNLPFFGFKNKNHLTILR